VKAAPVVKFYLSFFIFAVKLGFEGKLAFAWASRVALPSEHKACKYLPASGRPSAKEAVDEKKLLTKEAVDEKKLWTKRSCGRKKKLMILCLSAPVFQHPLLQSFTEQ
jgi:hypothetical protein